MKFSAKYISLAVLAALFFLPGMVKAACNDVNGNQFDLSIIGDRYVEYGKEYTYELVVKRQDESVVENPTGVGPFKGGFTVVGYLNNLTTKVKYRADENPSKFVKFIWTNHSGDCVPEINPILFEMDLDVDSDNTGNVDRSPAEENVENASGSLGKVINVNSNDSNSDGDADCSDHEIDGDSDKNDMAKVVFNLNVCSDVSSDYKIEYAVSDWSKVHIFFLPSGSEMKPKEGEDTWSIRQQTVKNIMGNLLVEGVSGGEVTIDMILSVSNGTDDNGDTIYKEIGRDTVKLTIVDFDLDVDANLDGSYTGSEEKFEEGEVGTLISVNNDFHSGTTVRDCDNSYIDGLFDFLQLLCEPSMLQLKTASIPEGSLVQISLSDKTKARMHMLSGDGLVNWTYYYPVLGPEYESSSAEAPYANLPETMTFIIEGVAPAKGVEFTATLKVPKGNDEYIEFSDKIVFTPYAIQMITPDGDPVNSPKSTEGDGQNEFTFSNASPGPGVLTLDLKASVAPSGIASQIKDRVSFEVGTIGNSVLSWAKTDGSINDVDGDYLYATAYFTGLPANYDDFGKKIASIEMAHRIYNANYYEVFYDAIAYNHPKNPSDPQPDDDYKIEINWFYYYRQNEGGTEYQYEYTHTDDSAHTHPPFPASDESVIHFAPQTFYPAQAYHTYSFVNGKLKLYGPSNAEVDYYTRFIIVLEHERAHAYDNVEKGAANGDSDRDGLDGDFEETTAHTAYLFQDAYSAVRPEGNLFTYYNANPGAKYYLNNDGDIYSGIYNYWVDSEAYGHSIVKKAVFDAGVDTSNDWGDPGSNHEQPEARGKWWEGQEWFGMGW